MTTKVRTAVIFLQGRPISRPPVPQLATGASVENRNATIALNATVHWLFDRHCISVDEQYRLLFDELRVPSGVRGLLLPATRGLRLPIDKRI